ncbi:GntR family transcriptional regulator [Pseudochryseolinea flava]|uniref:Transcriptional regulator n=1 Tax=Pseudochryseolinea flava TaxID=2059302 RepID=A0A364Y2L9_9BACT|nr:GntR family transcriptional regulator [Pseudochryseolinea flava]RAW01123.1 transcriptional regulator [Pseudochryseolinea flava]
MKETECLIEIRIDSESRIPKYRQIINSIIQDIEAGILSVGQRIPSINEISEEYYLSRDTVEKAYNFLKEQQIIISAKGKGYYVARHLFPSKVRVLFLLNKLSSYKLRIYNSFVDSLGQHAQVDLNIYHCDPKIFLTTINENIGRYDQYVIMPHFKDEHDVHQSITPEVLEALRKIPEDKLVILDNYLPDLRREVGFIYQDFKMDIYDALSEGKDRLKRYEKLILVYPRKTVYPYPIEILQGFKKFCNDRDFDFEVLDEIYPDMDLRTNDAYIIIEEADLVSLMKQVRDKNFILGQDIGIISYNDTPLKDLLGITVISTDFQVMGETAAYMIMKKKKEMVKNVFSLINRHSI